MMRNAFYWDQTELSGIGLSQHYRVGGCLLWFLSNMLRASWFVKPCDLQNLMVDMGGTSCIVESRKPLPSSSVSLEAVIFDSLLLLAVLSSTLIQVVINCWRFLTSVILWSLLARRGLMPQNKSFTDYAEPILLETITCLTHVCVQIMNCQSPGRYFRLSFQTDDRSPQFTTSLCFPFCSRGLSKGTV